MTDDLADAVSILVAKRDEHLRRVALLDDAIRTLERLQEGSPVSERTYGSRELPPAKDRQPIGVPAACLTLMREGPRDWSAEEIVREYERRGQPLEVANPLNSVFSALSRLSKQTKLVRTRTGRYAACEFADQFVQGADSASSLHGSVQSNGHSAHVDDQVHNLASVDQVMGVIG